MQKSQIIDAIRQVLADELNIANIGAFSPTARLNEDLYLDSVLVLQLLISLELKLDIEVPDEALNAEDFVSVDTLSEFLLKKLQPETTEHVTEDAAEEFEDIKVHCFVSCLCQAIKANPNVDHRPFYFGVWDAEVVVDANHQINYHAEGLNHDFFRDWYQKIYGVEVLPWFEHDRDKAYNISKLSKLLDDKTDLQQIMVMLDMYRLPERENKFNANPFPHYVMLENMDDPDKLFMHDPDFRWEGEQDKQQVFYSIESDAVAGGYIFDANAIKPCTNQVIHDYFKACINVQTNPMTDAVRSIINAHLSDTYDLSPGAFTDALMQLPVLSIRKYAYEHGLAFFMLQLEMDFTEFEDWCEVIEALVSGYKQIQFRAMKIANLEQNFEGAAQDKNQLIAELAVEIEHILNQQDEREFSIKKRMVELFDIWSEQCDLNAKTKPVDEEVSA
ncbi:phosphopantetheine-binding protein [Catenovulum sp. SM1970]|uniref:DUF6005 family protein n=1 Tax=Marinifaba aquimaris TaxID=2741323 RepID=UPI001571A005|nr:DUF6005 family protein [Marinifaba aquimaris]NTS78837.1 phosphopantetheine-binding protein [Marinifaba aquimaris]